MAHTPSALTNAGCVCTHRQARHISGTAALLVSARANSGRQQARIIAAAVQMMRCTLTCRRSTTAVSTGCKRMELPITAASSTPETVFDSPRCR